VRTSLTFIPANSFSHQLCRRMRLIGLLALLIVVAMSFVSVDKSRIAFYSPLGEAQEIDPTFTEITKLIASDDVAGSNFGFSVAIYGDTAIVGVPFDNIGTNALQGSAYIFQRNQGGTDQWRQVKKLTASDGEAFDIFGLSVAIYGDTVIVGTSDTIGSNFSQGSVYVFERNQGGPNNWGEIKKLTASDGAAFDRFGDAVAIYGDTAIIGAFADDIGGNDNQGSVYVFERNQGGANNWGEVKRLTASDGAVSDQFGSYVAIYGDTVIIGAPDTDIGSNFSQGSAYVFERNQGGPNNWAEVKKLIASDGTVFAKFGVVAIHGDTAIIGTPGGETGIINNRGAAYLFERNQGGPNNWGEVKKLIAADSIVPEAFGFSVAIYQDTVIIGTFIDLFSGITAPGAAYVFGRNQGGPNNWGEAQKIIPSDSANNDLFGASVAIYEGTAVIGGASDLVGDSGSAYIFMASPTAPAISAVHVTLVEGAPASISTIARVSDPNQAADTLTVTVNGTASATVSGVTISNITVDASGEVRAEIAAACRAATNFFTLRVTDSEGQSSEDTLNVTVTPDEVPPTLTLRPSIQRFPPNHTYFTVRVDDMVESISDNCSSLSLASVIIEQVTSDEPDNALTDADGDTTNDIMMGLDCRTVQLRAERDETNDGRVYTITLLLRDNRGNVTRQDFEVSVPIDRNGIPAVKGPPVISVTTGCQ
jgi:FG-GAP repeat protein